ncbi:uncharacterized protein LOC102810202 [Saccoglossus kowalevskii]
MEATDCALNLEHIIFKDSKQSNIYRGKIFSKVAEINKATKSKELHYVLTSKSGNVTQSAKEESNSSDVGVSAVNVPQASTVYLVQLSGHLPGFFTFSEIVDIYKRFSDFR